MTRENAFRLLLIADIHAVPRGTDKSNELEKRGYNCWLGKELLRRAIEDAKLRGGFDAIAFMGDMVVNGDAPWASECVPRTVRRGLHRRPGNAATGGTRESRPRPGAVT